MKAEGRKQKVRSKKEKWSALDATHLRRGYGAPSIEGKVTRVGATERGSERVSIKKKNASYRMVISFAGNRIGAIARTMGRRSMPPRVRPPRRVN